MAKRLFYFAVSAIALTACTSQDVVDDVVATGTVIQFENVVNKSSRAPEINSKSLSHFNVFGFYTLPGKPSVAHEVFHDVSVDRQDNGSWKCAVDRHWVKDARFYFYAYSCGNSQLSEGYGDFTMDMKGDLAASDRVLKISGYLCDSEHQHDLVFASNTGAVEGDEFAGILATESGNLPVPLQFKHILSKIKARFTTTFPSEYVVEISNVKVVNIRNTGDYHPSTGWSNVNRPEGEQPFVYLLKTSDSNVKPISVKNEIDNDTKKQKSVDTETAFVLPYGYAGSEGSETEASTFVYLNFDIRVTCDGNFILSKSLSGKFNPIWERGYSYVYNVEIGPSESGLQVITFTTGEDEDHNIVTNWKDSEAPVYIDK